MSQFERFSNLYITKKLAKENSVLNFTLYFIQVKALAFSLKHIKMCYKRLKIQLKSFST